VKTATPLAAIACGLSLKEDSFVDISGVGQEIVIKPVKKNNLAEMLSKINDQNIHDEIDTGGAVGKEAW